MASVFQWLVSATLVAVCASAPQQVDFFNGDTLRSSSANPNFGTFTTASSNPRFGPLSPSGSTPQFGTFSTASSIPPFGAFSTPGSNPQFGALSTSSASPPFSPFSTAISNPQFGAFRTTSSSPQFSTFSTANSDPRFGTFSTDNPQVGTFGFTDGLPTDTTFPFEFSTVSPTFEPTDFNGVGFTESFNNAPIGGSCRVHFVSDDEVQWSSPNFGRREYPNNARCKLSLSSRAPGYATFEFSNQGYDIKSGDFIDFNQPIRMAKLGRIWDGFASPNTVFGGDLPTFNFDAEFRSDSAGTGAGFNVTISRKTTNCHKIVNRGGTQTSGTLEAPTEGNFGSGFQTKRSCEWWIRAPEGKRIQLQILNLRVTSSVYSEYDENGVVIVDKLGDKYYPELTSLDFVGTSLPDPIKSIGNRMNVIFYSGTLTDTFRARWTVV
ncbi:cubilin-like [Palaemon carinicauda]|uniref:cubilin-like n=1 Tax=Palaemon carinicauda TaxID=392227 RepID=UPI0035B5AF1D